MLHDAVGAPFHNYMEVPESDQTPHYPAFSGRFSPTSRFIVSQYVRMVTIISHVIWLPPVVFEVTKLGGNLSDGGRI